ncbi:MAG: family 43 glycosylhydrolase, partial [Lachnospiraceae bacterium]|nr:family 43 glycosylhydrolase [Lachnospiraceae bacterium]
MGKKSRVMRTRSTAVSLALMLTVGGMPINALAAEVRTESAVESFLETSEAAKKPTRKKVSVEYAINGDVATGTTEGWSVTNTERGEIDVASVNALKKSGDEGTDDDGNYCLWVKNRETTGAGAQQDLSGKLEIGKTYKFKGRLMYKDGPEQKAFRLEIQNGPSYRYRDNIVQFTAKKGEWTEFEGEYTIPESVSCEGKEWAFTDDTNYVFVETPWSGSPTKENDLMDYYLDDFSMTVETKDEELVGNGDVEAGLEGWSTYEHVDGTTEDLDIVTTDDAHSGKKAVRVINRAYTNDGVCQVFEDEFREGYTYNFSAWVKQDQVDSQTISMTVRKGKEESFTTIASAEAKKGEWVHLQGSYTFAESDDTSIDKVFFETPWKSAQNTTEADLIDITVDDLSIIEKAMEADEGSRDYRDSDIKANLEVSDEEVLGVVNKEFEAKLKLDKLEKNSYKNLKVSVALPDKIGVEDVVFNKDAISGEASYKAEDGRLVIEVNGDDIGFDAEDGLFATVKLKLNGYVRKDTKADIVTEYAHIDGGKETFYAVKDAKKTVMLKFLDTGAIAKQLGCSNPLMTQELGADPYALVYNDRVYVYMTADDYEYDANGNLKSNSFNYIKTLRVISSSDMVNWTDHGEIKVAGEDGAAKWASHSWAPAIAHKNINGKDKFFVYFANDASGIGVLEGDTPIGPWKDPIGKALITRQTPGCAGVTWCFDPAVLVDDDGSAYIYFGGGVPNDGRGGEQNNPHTARVAKLGDDMISIDGEAVEIDAPAMFEDSGIFKYDGKYYYSYCSNFINPHKDGYPGYGNIAYMTSDSPMGPFKYTGEIFDNPQKWFNVGGNNHHATFVFRGKSYFIYHAQTVAKELGKANGYRSTHIDPIELDEDGNILPVKGTYEGISQLESMNPYKTIEAETIAWNKGIKVSNIDDVNREITSLDDGDWTSVAGVDFGEEGADKFTAKVKSDKGGKIEVRLDSPEGSLIGTLEVPAGTDEYKELSTEVTPVSGERNVFFVFRGEGEDLMTVDSYVFTEKGASVNPDVPEEDPEVKPDEPQPVDPGKDKPEESNDKPAPTPKPDKPEEKSEDSKDKPADKPEEKKEE